MMKRIFILLNLFALACFGFGGEEEIIANLRLAAEQGDTEAQLELGTCYETGWSVKKDPIEAVKWYRKAATTGNSNAQIALARCYWSGFGVEASPSQAVSWYKKAMDSGDNLAPMELALLYGWQNDNGNAIIWYKKAAEKGCDFALICLAELYRSDFFFSSEYTEQEREDGKEAAFWYAKAINKGYHGACKIYQAYGRARDKINAGIWCKKAAEEGYQKAQKDLAMCYAWGFWGIEENSQKARFWQHEASKQEYQ